MVRNFKMSNQTTRASLLTRVSSLADAEAWHEFCAMYGVLIQATARRSGLQQTDCDDITQAVFTSMVISMPGFVYDPTGRGRFRAYLKTTTLREIARWRRRACNGAARPPSEIVTEVPAHDHLETVWASEWRQHHIRCALRRVESEFSDQDLEAFRRYALQNVEPQQVARDMGMTIHQVYKAKTRILHRLRDIVREQIALES